MWPASGEIDIVESRGNVNYPREAGGGASSFGSALHWGPDWSQNRYSMTQKDYHHDGLLSDGFHTYGLYWSEDRLFTYIDDDSNIVLDVDFTQQSMWEKGGFTSNYDNPWEGKNDIFSLRKKIFFCEVSKECFFLRSRSKFCFEVKQG